MDNFQIQTAQNVTIDQNLANYFERAAAFFIDILILLAYLFLVGFIFPLLGASSFAVSMVVTLPLLLYHLVMELAMNGQSVGKAAMKIRVVCVDGSKPKAGHYLIRWCLRLIDISISFGSVASLFILFGGKGQRLGDLAAKTTVISERNRVDFTQTIIMDVPENYQPKYPQVTIFSDEDMRQTKAIYMKAKRQREYHLINKLHQQLMSKMEVQPQEKSLQFVETVLRDYNYYTQR
ncbi:RDD family protein [Flavobacteriaceae bacterium 14752]|uniref:RDD family protein n=1 Tax=Mesohalobacter salilacus TaxID=2491711 RepID=UPI000F63986A|nr:RDD family protein [Flavobacteriaceae bacterium 14752]